MIEGYEPSHTTKELIRAIKRMDEELSRACLSERIEGQGRLDAEMELDATRAELAAAEKRADEAREGWRSAVDALRWCGGSADFQPEGRAREGWVRIAEPVLKQWEERNP